MFKISEKSDGKTIENLQNFLSSHSVKKHRSLNFTPAILHRFENLEPMLLIDRTLDYKLEGWWFKALP